MLKTMKVELPNSGSADPVIIPEGKSWMITAYDGSGGYSILDVDGSAFYLDAHPKPMFPEGTEITRYNSGSSWTTVIYVLELNNDN